jgi:hypothetical protein
VFFVPLWFNPELSGLFNSRSLGFSLVLNCSQNTAVQLLIGLFIGLFIGLPVELFIGLSTELPVGCQ